LESIYDENDENEILEQSLRNLIFNAISTFDIATEETTKEVRELNNFLIHNNAEMIKEIIDFIQKNSGPNISKNSIRKFTDTLNNLNKWSYDNSNRNEDIKISNDAMYNITNFYKTYIQNFIDIFPNIIFQVLAFTLQSFFTVFFHILTFSIFLPLIILVIFLTLPSLKHQFYF
jgi:hypothetical protein